MKTRLIKWQRLQEKDRNTNYGWYMENHYKPQKKNKNTSEVYGENTLANPDELDESAGLYYVEQNQEQSDAVQKLLKNAKKVLTKREYEAFELLTGFKGAEPQTIRSAAMIMQLSPGRVGQLWDSTRGKLKAVWEGMNSANED